MTHILTANKLYAAIAALSAIAVAMVFTVPATSAQIVSGASGTSRVGELIVLDSLFNGSNDGTGVGNVSRVGELIVLDSLFGSSNDTSVGTSRIGELIVLDGLFR